MTVASPKFVAGRLTSAIFALGAITAAAVWLFSAIPFVGSVDLSVFLCHARDMSTGVAPSPDSAYRYFPGVYVFWRTVFAVGGQSHASAQVGVVCLLAANAVLIVLISIRLKQSVVIATGAAVTWLIIASRYEGLSGTTEPLSNVFFLFAIWVLAGSQSIRQTVLAGVFLGLCVWTKQQAGLLTLSAVWMLVGSSKEFRNRLLSVSALATTATMTLLMTIALEGKGLDPLRQGLAMAGSYSKEGSWASNLASAFGNDKSVVIFIAVAVAGLAIGRICSQPQNDENTGAVQRIGGICLLAFLATLIQFRTRGYYHYFLLGLPALIVAFVCGMAGFAQPFSERGRIKSVVYLGLAVLWLIPVLRSGSRELDFELASPKLDSGLEARPWWTQQPQVDEIEEIGRIINRPETMLVMPPLRSTIYLQTEGYQPNGYAFGAPNCIEKVNLNSTEFVVEVVDRDSRETSNWNSAGCDAKMVEVRASGFRNVYSGARLQLWQRVD